MDPDCTAALIVGIEYLVLSGEMDTDSIQDANMVETLECDERCTVNCGRTSPEAGYKPIHYV